MSVIWNNKYANLSSPKPIFTVLIAASGSGQRMGGVYKPLENLLDMPMIAYSFDAFEKNGYVKQIVVSAPKDKHDEIETLAKNMGITKLLCVTEGGQTRAESVKRAFVATFEKKENITPFVAIHDAARPLITEKMLNDVFSDCTKHGASACATKLRDAIKKAGHDNMITEEMSRENVWQMQTPQCFDTDIYHTSLAALGERANSAVDDVALVTSIGFKVICTECGFENFKVTYKEDLHLAEIILESRKVKE